MKVALFATCLVDHYFADAAADAVRLLRRLGCEVSFPPAQTCCGQPAHSAGMRPEALRMARHAGEAFRGTHAVVVPSGSCAAMVKKRYRRLANEAAGGPSSPSSARDASPAALAERTWELSEFIVRKLGVTGLGRGLRGRSVALHQGCHALRDLGLVREPAILLEGAGARIVPWDAARECCGFGGLFSVQTPEVSTAMADRKLDTLSGPDWVVSGDGGCLLHMEGRSRARGLDFEFVHLATALWRGASHGA